MEPATLRGRLLVATPPLADPNFDRTVVFVLEHSPTDGALGLVLNRPSQAAVEEILPRWADLAVAPARFFFGGPVSPSSVIGLGQAALPVHAAGGWQPLLSTVGALDLDDDPGSLAPAVEQVRLFAGYAGWSAAQLEAEIDAGGWFVCDADPGDLFTSEPHDLWAAVLRRQGGRLARYATIPADPTVN